MPDFRHSAPHPGPALKQLLDDKGVLVAQAATLLGVGRQALSKVLNEKADLTQEMATRIGKAFGEAEGQRLMAKQTALDDLRAAEQAKEIATRTHVRSFVGIRARQIGAWAQQESARPELPALLRRLVHSTGTHLTKVDFPAYDHAQRHGWDGVVITDSATPWIPRGQSGWEFGCNVNPAAKAEEDYAARSYAKKPKKKADADAAATTEEKGLTAEERRNTTFVFVTPRDWPGKDKWVKTKQAEGIWKDVIVHDADSLEQWLEQSVPTQSWFGEIIGNLGTGGAGTATMDICWREFADSCKPKLSKLLFHGAVESTKTKLDSWLRQPPNTAFVVTADSISEGLAFVACALQSAGPMPGEFYDRALYLKTPDALQRAVKAAPDFVVVVADPSVERVAAGVQETHHFLVVRLRNSISGEADIALDLVDDETYRKALSDMGLPEEDYQRFCRETGNSPTILRRRLSTIPAIHEPAWSGDADLGRALVPMMLAGAWGSDVPGDCAVMSALAGQPYDAVEEQVARLSAVPETPIWSIGRFRGVTSKIDVLFGAARSVTKSNLDDLFFVAELVLSEDDPALDLPPGEQWLAMVKGKKRDHSAALRAGLCETLVLLAVHGDNLFQKHLGVHLRDRVDQLIERLLTPLDARKWASQKSDLPRYAEAAPDVFLKVLETDLNSAAPKVHALLTPADSGILGSGCNRTGLLWALETLAWKSDQLLRVCRILARLAQIEINDNWVNKPEGSLAAIFRNWMPQTAATIEERNTVMEILCREFSAVGWRLIMGQFGNRHGVGHYSARPHWRNDAAGAGRTAKTWGEVWAVSDKARELAITWPHHTPTTLGDLVERLHDIKPEERDRIWAAVRKWTDENNDETSAHILRERIRKSAFTRRARIHNKMPGEARDQARDAYQRLEPKDPIIRSRWLFDTHWVDESSDELEDENLDYKARAARTEALRKAALTEIWSILGFDGLMRLIELTNAEWAIGLGLADIVAPEEREAVADKLAGQPAPPDDGKLRVVLGAFLIKQDAQDRGMMMESLVSKFVADDVPASASRLLRAAQFKAETWKLLDQLPPAWRDDYWRTVNPHWDDQDEAENNFMVDRLMEAKRPRAAFAVLHMDFNKLEARRLVNLLQVISISNDEGKHYQLAPHDVSEAFKSLSARARIEVSLAELAQLEFRYADVLDHTDYGIPTLEAQMAADPNLFMHLIALVYRRDDGPEPDRPEWEIADPEIKSSTATTAYSVLHKMSRLPGTDAEGTVDPTALLLWVQKVRDLGLRYGRLRSVDHTIGHLFGHAPKGKDGIWPCEPVRQAFDAVGSDPMSEGFHMGRYNHRGVHWRGEGGSDERTMSAEYRAWAKAVAFAYPFMAKALEDLGETYAREAVMHDTDAAVRRRLSH